MKKNNLAKLGLVGLVLQLAVLGQTAWADDAAPKTDSQKIGYALGMNFGANVKKIQEELKTSGVDLDVDNFMKGLKDTLAGGATSLTTDDVRTILTALQEKVQTAQAASMKDAGEKNMKAGQDFLAKNKSQPGIIELPDGVQYKILKAGTGPKPKREDTVFANYRATFIDGKEFDASKPGAPVKFPVTQVIPGWTEILQMMPTGSKWQVYIPGALAYGPEGRPGIPPNSTLIFDMELVSVESATAPALPTLPEMPK